MNLAASLNEPYQSFETDGALGRRLAVLARLDGADQLVLANLERTSEFFGADQPIPDDGDFVAVLEGLAIRHQELGDGRRQILAILLPGDLCAADSVTSLTRVRVARIERADLDAIQRNHPAIAQALRRAAEISEAIVCAWMVNLGQRRAHERVAHLFCELACRMQGADLLRAGCMFDLPLTQQALGCALGLTSVHINRVLQRLRAEALLEFRSGVVRIRDLVRLQALAGFDPAYLTAA